MYLYFASILNLFVFCFYFLLRNREQRSGNTLYQELSFQDSEALGETEDGVDVAGTNIYSNNTVCMIYVRSCEKNFWNEYEEFLNDILHSIRSKSHLWIINLPWITLTREHFKRY